MIEFLAMEAADTVESSGHMVDLMLVLGTFLLTFVTGITGWVTWKLYKVSLFEIRHATDEVSHANDNATSVALAEIHAHHVDSLKRIRNRSKGKIAR